MAKWEVGMDSYLGAERLDLVMADGKKVQPLYLAYRPPVMGPKSAVNPAAPDGAKKKTKATGKPMFKRELHELGGDDDDDDNDDTQAEADGKNNAKQSRDIVHGDDIVRIYRNKAAEEAGYDLPLIALWVAFTMIGIGSVTLLCN